LNKEKQFKRQFELCIDAASANKIATLGIKPTSIETGYGYIKRGKPANWGFEVEEFVEKPDIIKATEYLNDGNYYWNSGMYCLNIKTLMNELKKYNRPMFDIFQTNSFSQIENIYEIIESISIDNAISERSSDIITIPLEVDWIDVGCWDSIYNIMFKDENDNVKNGDCEIIDCKNSMFYATERLIAGVGLEDVIAIETDDVILLMKRGMSQEIKLLTDKIKDRKEARTPDTCKKPWGSYKVIHRSKGYLVKEIAVNPGQSLSLQLHNHRCENWIIVEGAATVIVGNQSERVVNKTEMVYIPKKTMHRLINNSKEVLKIIEVQSGDYLEEDDIVMYNDVYGRETDEYKEGI